MLLKKKSLHKYGRSNNIQEIKENFAIHMVYMSQW